MKGRYIIVPAQLQSQSLEELHSNDMGMEKTRPRAQESVYWLNMNKDIKETVKRISTCMGFQ